MKLTDKEINAMVAQPLDVRYDYSLKRIADNGSLWCLSSEEEYMFIQEKGVKLFPIWPFKEYANKYLLTLGFEKDYRCVEIGIENSQMNLSIIYAIMLFMSVCSPFRILTMAK